MPAGRLAMTKVREILRAKLSLDLTQRQVGQVAGCSVGKVSDVCVRARHLGLTWDAVQAMSDPELETRLYGEKTPLHSDRPLPDLKWMHRELRRVGVTLQLLHVEYIQEQPNGLRYSTFCSRYRRWLAERPMYMRQVHRAGEKTFIDYSGKRPVLTDPQTGERRPVELFVAVLGASSYTFAEATLTQQLPDWVASNERAYRFFGGVSELQVPDQLRSAVRKPCRYEPAINRTYLELAKHYDTAVLPARPAKPKDKAKAEVAVQVAQRWILARIRDETFYCLADLNKRIAELLSEINARPMRHLGASRHELFVQVDRPALRALPSEAFEYADWAHVRANGDYHCVFEKHYYSVPFRLRRARLEIRATARTVEILHCGDRIASHIRSSREHGFTTEAAHMPEAHQRQRDWEPELLKQWAAGVGECTRALVDRIFNSRPHPEQGYRSCRGLQRLEKTYGAERLEAASKRALLAGASGYQPVKHILVKGLDRLSPDQGVTLPDGDHIHHENVRGPDYYN